jgi:membrane-bound serine protease (ClpP class)
VTFVFFFFFIRKIWAARRQPAFVGADSMLGALGETRESIAPEGLVFVQGALWRASADRPIPAGSAVRVVGRQGLHLQVAPAGDGPPPNHGEASVSVGINGEAKEKS